MRRSAFFLLWVTLLFPSISMAQPPRHERRIEEFETLKMWRLTRELDLNEQEASRLFPLLKRHSRIRQELLGEHRGKLKELQELVDQSAPEEKIREKIAEVESCMRRMDEARWREWEEIKRVLPAQKQARYLIFQDRFVREFWKSLLRPPK